MRRLALLLTLTITACQGPSDPPGPDDDNTEPVATIDAPDEAIVVQEGESVTFAGTCTDPDDDTLTHAWDFGDLTSTDADPGDIVLPVGEHTVTYRCDDAEDTSETASVVVTVSEVESTRPTAVIDLPDDDLVVEEGESVTFAGTCTDPDDDTLTHAWDFGDLTSTDADPGDLVLPVGEHTVTYSCSDGETTSETASVVVTVSATVVNAEPTAAIDLPTEDVVVEEGESVIFAGTCADSDDDTFTHAWDFGDLASTDADPGAIVLPPGEHTVTYSCSDGEATSDIASVTVTVNPNAAPSVQIDAPLTDVVLNEGDMLELQATCSDADTPLSHAWSLGQTVEDPGMVAVPALGTYEVTYTCTDALGAASSASFQLLVNDIPSAQIDAPTDLVTTVAEGEGVTFSGTCTDSDAGATPAHDWNLDVEGSTTDADPGEIVFSTPGYYEVTYRCTDEHGAQSPVVTRNVEVNGRPSGTIEAPATALTINHGDTVDFASSCTDPELDEPLSHLWTFDGAAEDAETAAPSINFDTPGEFEVTYTCSDGRGAADATPETVTVTVNGAPWASIDDSSEITIAVGEAVSFSGTCTDPDGPGELVHEWQFDTHLDAANVEDPGEVTFDVPGDFQVLYTCTDGLDASGVAQKIVHVRPLRTIGGRVTGYAGSGLVLQNNGEDAIPVFRSEDFTFPLSVREGLDYEVTVATSPDGPAQVCDVYDGSGTVGTSDVRDVLVYCHSEGAPFFVTPTGAGSSDGSSWQNAATIDQLGAMAPGQVAWVQAGVYRNTLAALSTTPVAAVPAGHAIYGGFAGSETDFSERAGLESILDGDVNDDDVVDATDTHPVVMMNDRTEIDGFVVREGNANGGATNSYGGGAKVVFGSTATFADVTFIENHGEAGAAIDVQGSSHAMILGCQFIGNVATSASGNSGAVYSGSSTLRIVDSLFYRNQAEVGGAVHYARFSSSSVLAVLRTAFIQNSAQTSGAMRIDGGDAYLDDNLFLRNTATAVNGVGGALELISGYSTNRQVHINGTIFAENSASARGGAIQFSDVETVARDVVFWNNQTVTSAGGAFQGLSRAFYGSQISATGNTSGTTGALTQGTITVALERSAIYHPEGSWGSNVQSWCNDTCIDSQRPSNNDSLMTVLDGSTESLGNPFSATPSGHLFLTQEAAGAPFTSACVDAGTAVPTETTWKATTTREDLVLDVPQIDRGAHYHPNAAIIWEAQADASTLVWGTTGVTACWLYNDLDETVDVLPSSGNLPHGKAPGAVLTLLCAGEAGAPAAVVLETD